VLFKKFGEFTFSSFKRLLWLNLDNNHLRDIPVASLPPTIVTLSVTNNYITKFPLDVTNSLPSLTWFTLRGNYIETLPGTYFPFNFVTVFKLFILRQRFSTPWVDFINVLRTAFTPVAPQSVRTQSSCQYLFMLLGSTV